jgi:hypothetical protein
MALWRKRIICAFTAIAIPAIADAQSIQTPTESAVKCIDGTLRKEGQIPGDTPVFKYHSMFDFDKMLDIVASCRHAMDNIKNERNIIVAEYISSELLYISAIGIKLPLDEATIFSQAERECKKEENNNSFQKMVCGYLLGSAFEYGIGTQKDASRALQAYRSAALAGSKVAAREAARLERAASRQ